MSGVARARVLTFVVKINGRVKVTVENQVF